MENGYRLTPDDGMRKTQVDIRQMTDKMLDMLEYIGSNAPTDLSGTNVSYKSCSGKMKGLGSLKKHGLAEEKDGLYIPTKDGQNVLDIRKGLCKTEAEIREIKSRAVQMEDRNMRIMSTIERHRREGDGGAFVVYLDQLCKESGAEMYHEELGEFMLAQSKDYGKRFFVSERDDKGRRYRIFPNMWDDVWREYMSKTSGTATV